MPSLIAHYSQLAGNYPQITKPSTKLNPTVYQCPQDPNGPQCVRQAMAQFGSGTSCCVQMSHALNLSGIKVPSRSIQRSLPYLKSNGFYYLGNVYELEDFLTNRSTGCFAGEVLRDLNSGIDPPPTGGGGMMNYLQGRQGILLFRDYVVGAHTELWDGQNILQKSIMNSGWCWSQPRILFWDALASSSDGDDGDDDDDSDC